MDPTIIIIALLFFTSVIMALAMGVAWLHFGRQRHVLSWALSYGIAAVQWLANAGGVALQSGVLMAVTACCIVVSGTLMLVGVRQRSGRPLPRLTLIVLGALAGGGGIYAAVIGDRSLQGMIVPFYVGVLMIWSAVALWPRNRRLNAPELAFFSMSITLALFEVGLVASAAMDFGRVPGEGLAFYRVLLGLGLPSIYVGLGVAAIMVVAGDLAYQLRKQMRHDPLTNVLNRRGLDEAAVRAIGHANRNQRPLALVICDLDGFKALNDGHGHIAGDEALRGFARLLTSAVRRGDIVARMGGDEFGLLLIDTDAAAADDVMERVRVEISCLIVPNAQEAALQASFGVAELIASDATLEDMVARADTALYQAKKDGKNRVAIWRAASPSAEGWFVEGTQLAAV